MAKKRIPKKILKEVDQYVESLRQARLPIAGVYVFGSYAKGTPRQWSDIDVCVVSRRFTDAWEALRYLLKRVQPNGNPYQPTIEPIGFSPRDFREGSSLINEIKQTGIKII